MFNITSYGATETGLATGAIQQAIDECFAQGGGQVVVPSGRFLTGGLRLRSNVELHLSAGSVLSFSTDPADYQVITARWEGVKQEVYAACIYAEDAENIAVTGFGTLEGNGADWWHLFRNHPEDLAYPRPTLVSFQRCENVTLRDFRCLNSPSWTIHPLLSENITIDSLKIKNPADSPNTDGIDPESCKNVRISNCHIDVGDDCIAVKAGTEGTKERVSCENLTITNCTMVHGHGGVVLGSEMSGDIRNVTISNCVFQETDRGIRLKSRRGRGGTVEDIRVTNIVMDKVICPFIMNLYYFCGPGGKEPYVWEKKAYPIDERTPDFRRIHFSNITARNVQGAAGFIYGLAERFISEITFDNIAISMAEDSKGGVPAMMTGIEHMTNRGFILGFAQGISFHQVSLANFEGPAFTLEDTQEIEFSRCQTDGVPLTEEQILRK